MTTVLKKGGSWSKLLIKYSPPHWKNKSLVQKLTTSLMDYIFTQLYNVHLQKQNEKKKKKEK